VFPGLLPTEKPWGLALLGAAEVNGEGVFLDQMVARVPADGEPVPRLLVVPAPAAGQVAVYSRADLQAWLRAYAPDWVTSQWSGAQRLYVRRRTRALDEVEMREMMTEVLQRESVKERGELELRFSRPWTAVQVPDEPLTLRVVDMPATGPGANFMVRYELWCGTERVGQWQLAMSAKVWRDLPVAQAPLKRGQTLDSVAVALERRDILALRDAPGVFDLGDPTLELAHNVAAGQPILARSVRARPVVVRGQVVEAQVRDGTLTIAMKVEALEDGVVGQSVRVRNTRTRRNFVGKVQDEQVIVITH
jgi:flagella basal body P-ring formation protein FlgA